MRTGDGRFTTAQRAELTRALSHASQGSGLTFRLYVGALPLGRESACAVLAAGGEAADTVLVAIDPASRSLEVVTGSRAATVLDDRTCALAALTMTSSFSAGDLVGGIRNGVQALGDHARRSTRRHLEST